MKYQHLRSIKQSHENNLHLTKFLKHVFTEIEIYPTSMSSIPLTSSFASQSQIDNFFVFNMLLWNKYFCIHAFAYICVCIYTTHLFISIYLSSFIHLSIIYLSNCNPSINLSINIYVRFLLVMFASWQITHYWTSDIDGHSWQRLILHLSEVISCL